MLRCVSRSTLFPGRRETTVDERLARPVRLAQYRSAGRVMKPAGCLWQSPHGHRPPFNRTVSDGPELSPGIPPHEIHVVVPPPPGTGALGVGDLVMPHYAPAINRYPVPSAKVRNQPCRGPVHLLGEPGRVVEVSFVLDAQRRSIHVPGTGLPGDIDVADALGYLTIDGPDHVVGRNLRARRLKPVDRRRVGALGYVDHDRLYLGGSPVGSGVVRRVGRVPD